MIKEVSKSQLNMWRSVIALVLADEVSHDSELRFLQEAFNKLPLTAAQRQILEDDLETPKNVNEFFPKITEPSDRSQFIYFARLLFWSDGDFSEQEAKILQQLRTDVLKKADLEVAMKKVENITYEFQEQEAQEKSGFRGMIMSLVEKVLR